MPGSVPAERQKGGEVDKGIRGLIYPASSDVHGRRILVCDTTLEGVALLRSISIVRRMQF